MKNKFFFIFIYNYILKYIISTLNLHILSFNVFMTFYFSGITEPKNVKLLYDVLKFELVEINNAILFVTKNTIVCETPEDARILAYEINPYHRINVRMNIIL